MRRLAAMFLMVACLGLLPASAWAVSMTLNPAHSVPGNMHSDRGSPNVNYSLKWQKVGLSSGTSANWYFGLNSFDMHKALGGIPAGIDGGGSFAASGSIDFKVATGPGNLGGKYYDGYNPLGTSLGMLGTFDLSAIEFSADGFSLTLHGMLNIASIMNADFEGLGSSIPLTITVLKISANEGGQNSFIEKYKDFAKGGAGQVNFDGSAGGANRVAPPPSATPEPGTWLLFASTLGALFLVRRRWRTALA